MSIRRRILAMVAVATPLASGLAPSIAAAQQLSGTAEMSAEGYGVSGREARRPAAIGRVSLAPVFDLWGIQVGANLTWDSETQFAARSLNRYALNPRWTTGEAWVGDHAPSLGATMLEGTVIRGAGVRLQRGLLTLRLHGGRADDVAFVDPLGFGTVDARLAAPRVKPLHRAIGAGALSIGSVRNSITFTGLWASDREPALGDTVAPAPQANVIGGIDLFTEFRPGWRLEAGARASLHNYDTRNDSLPFSFKEEFGGIAALLDKLFTVRSGTRGDVAWHTEVAAPAPWGAVRVRAERIGPGYVSLGVPTLPSDWQQVEGSTSFSLARGRVNGLVGGGVRTDGVLASGAGETWRGTGTAALNVAEGPWSVNLSAMLNKLERRAVVDTFGLVNVARAMSIAPRLALGSAHAVGVSASWQENETEAGILAPYGARSFNAAVQWEWLMRDGLTLAVSPALVTASDTARLERLSTASATLGWRPREGRASGSFSVSGGQSLIGDQLQVAGDLRLKLGAIGSAVARARLARFTGSVTYREALVSLGITRSF